MKSGNGSAGPNERRLTRRRTPTSLLLTIFAVAVGVALSVAVRLNISPTNEYDPLRRDSDVSSSSGKSVASLESSVPASPPIAGLASEMQSLGTSSQIGEPQVKQPSGDLLAAIKKAQAERGTQPVSPPTGNSWQGMSPTEAAKTFEAAVKAASASSAVSPFGSRKATN